MFQQLNWKDITFDKEIMKKLSLLDTIDTNKWPSIPQSEKCRAQKKRKFIMYLFVEIMIYISIGIYLEVLGGTGKSSDIRWGVTNSPNTKFLYNKAVCI